LPNRVIHLINPQCQGMFGPEYCKVVHAVGDDVSVTLLLSLDTLTERVMEAWGLVPFQPINITLKVSRGLLFVLFSSPCTDGTAPKGYECQGDSTLFSPSRLIHLTRRFVQDYMRAPPPKVKVWQEDFDGNHYQQVGFFAMSARTCFQSHSSLHE
jgi:hypothetical protein